MAGGPHRWHTQGWFSHKEAHKGSQRGHTRGSGGDSQGAHEGGYNSGLTRGAKSYNGALKKTYNTRGLSQGAQSLPMRHIHKIIRRKNGK